MAVQVGKWGNSLAVRLPASVVDALKLREGDDIEITLADDGSFRVARDPARAAALERLRKRAWPLPPGFKFDRDDANER